MTNLDCEGLVCERGRDRITIRGKLTREETDWFTKEFDKPGKLVRVPPSWSALKGNLTRIRSEPRFHQWVLINGDPKIGEGTKIGIFSEVHDKGGVVAIGKNCDIASFVAINCADSHNQVLGLSASRTYRPIRIEDSVFVGSHTFIPGGTEIGHHCVIAAGTIVKPGKYPPYSLIWGNRCKTKRGHYAPRA